MTKENENKSTRVEGAEDNKQSTSGSTSEYAAPPKPTPSDVSLILALVVYLVLASTTSQYLLLPLFGRTIDSMTFHAGTLCSIILFTYILDNSAKNLSRALGLVPILGVVASFSIKPLARITAGHASHPTLAAFFLHIVLTYPLIGQAGAVLIHMASKFMEPEATTLGRVTVLSFACVALASVVKFADELFSGVVTPLLAYNPRLFMSLLTGYSWILGQACLRSVRDTRNSPLGSMTLNMIIGVGSVAVLAIMTAFPQATSSLTVRHQQFTTLGLVQVLEDRSKAVSELLLRLNTEITQVAQIRENGSLGDAVNPADAILSNVRFAQGLSGKRALILGVSNGVSARALASSAFETIVVDTRPTIIEISEAYFELPASVDVEIADPYAWLQENSQTSAKFDVVLHDLFEGMLPAQYYSTEFWSSVKDLMSDESLLAVKITAKAASITTKSVVNTLRKNFDTCRLFHGTTLEPSSPKNLDEFIDLVVFCSPKDKVTFKTDKSRLASLVSRDSSPISLMEKHEVQIEELLGSTPPERYILSENDPVMRRWGKESIVDFWKAMRGRYPEPVWSNY